MEYNKEQARQTVNKHMNKDFLRHLEIDDLKRLAIYHEKTARDLKIRAAEMQKNHDMKAKIRQRVNKITREHKQLCIAMMHEMECGKNFDQAARYGASISGRDLVFCQTSLKRFVFEEKNKARHARKMATFKLAKCGFTNEEIAARLGVHRNTVSKDIRDAIEARRMVI